MATPSTAETPKPTCDYGPPTSSGTIPFTPPGTSRSCSTAYWIWGALSTPSSSSSTSTVPLIALHGGPGGTARDAQVLGMLSKTHGVPVILYDQIGCGSSTHLRELRGDKTFWTDALFLAELTNLIAYFKLERFNLWGHSCGGMLAVAYALTQPQGLHKLISASAYLADSLRVKAVARHRAALPKEMQDDMARCEREGRKDAPEYKRGSEESARLHCTRLDPWPAELREAFRLGNEDDTVAFTLYGEDDWVNSGTRGSFNLLPRLHEITDQTVPGGILITNGVHEIADDLFAPLFTMSRARVKWVRFAESAHFSHLDEHEAYLAAVGDFLTME